MPDSEVSLKRQILAVDADGNRQLDQEEFLHFMDNRISPLFNDMNVSHTGKISLSEFRSWLVKQGMNGEVANQFFCK